MVADNPLSQLSDARQRLRDLLRESRETLEQTANSKPLPLYSFQFTPAPRNVTVSVKTYNPRGENEDPLFLPIIAESRHRRTLRSCVTVVEITSTDEEEKEEEEEKENEKQEIKNIESSSVNNITKGDDNKINIEQNKDDKDNTKEENTELDNTTSSDDNIPVLTSIDNNKNTTNNTKKQKELKKDDIDSDDDDSSDDIVIPVIPKGPSTWPELPKKVDPESVKTAQDKEWWDDEILRCGIALLKKDELEPELLEGILVYSPLEAVSLLYHGEIESPPSNIKRIFLPLHVDGTHWCLLEISASKDRQTLFVTLFDSLPLLNTAEWFQFRWQEVNRAIEGLARCKVFAKLGWRAKNIEIARIDRRQTNIYDCGPYTVEFLKKRINNERGDTVSAFEAAMRRETIKDWLESGEVEVPVDKATVERIKAETEVIEPSKNLVQVKSRLRGKLSAMFDS